LNEKNFREKTGSDVQVLSENHFNGKEYPSILNLIKEKLIN
jgi:hypothetical protein